MTERFEMRLEGNTRRLIVGLNEMLSKEELSNSIKETMLKFIDYLEPSP
ncbi:MAG: hypothetical protein P8182_17890 [Deltaproteobacteria bacterium]